MPLPIGLGALGSTLARVGGTFAYRSGTGGVGGIHLTNAGKVTAGYAAVEGIGGIKSAHNKRNREK